MDSNPKRLQRWSSEDVLLQIKNLSDLSAKYNQKNFPSLYGAAVRHFGSWREAIEAAGVPYSTVSKRKPAGYWSKERVIHAIQSLPEKRSGLVRKKHSDVYNAAMRYFASWKDAVNAAGFDYEVIRRGWVPDQRRRSNIRKDK